MSLEVLMLGLPRLGRIAMRGPWGWRSCYFGVRFGTVYIRSFKREHIAAWHSLVRTALETANRDKSESDTTPYTHICIKIPTICLGETLSIYQLFYVWLSFGFFPPAQILVFLSKLKNEHKVKVIKKQPLDTDLQNMQSLL